MKTGRHLQITAFPGSCFPEFQIVSPAPIKGVTPEVIGVSDCGRSMIGVSTLDKMAVGRELGLWYGFSSGKAIATACAWRVVSHHHAWAWALMCSIYLHVNQVRIRALGLVKAERVREKAGMMPERPSPEVIARRLAKLRGYPWSSYPAYAGYTVAPAWLTRDNLWIRTRLSKERTLRQNAEKILRLAHLTWKEAR